MRCPAAPLRLFFFLIIPRQPRSTLFPYTTLFRSDEARFIVDVVQALAQDGVTLDAIALLYRSNAQRSAIARSEEHTSELQSQSNLVCRLLLEKKKKHK